jgi:hypothetical protein
MTDQLPQPDFNAQNYARPNQKWVCGWDCDGRACKLGPTPGGQCRVTYECTPALERKMFEEKGRWKCTRGKDQGGPCEHGPLPDGTCCRPLPRCTPVRSLRAKRGRLTIAVCALTVGVLLLLLCGPARFKFINPGPISSHHTGKAFAELKGAAFGANEGCHNCHTAAPKGPSGWLHAAFTVTPGPFQLDKLAATHEPGMTAIDRQCQSCHDELNRGKADVVRNHAFHQPNVTRDHSCSACHREHLSGGHMIKPSDAQCLSCHGDGAAMQASMLKGKELAAKTPGAFEFRPSRGREAFEAPRPERGYTQVLHSFAEDHPEFQIHAMQLKDTNPLRFNHALHLSSALPPRNGKHLGCADCHRPEESGAYYRKVEFEHSCRVCHSLQFDSKNSSMQLPHGTEATIRAFLHSLPFQYTDYGRSVRKLTGTNELAQFVRDSVSHVHTNYLSGVNMERQIFLGTDRFAPAASAGASATVGRALFPGCAWCHQVAETAPENYEIARPNQPERWMVRGNFDHSKHLIVACTRCHEHITQSRVTSDINLPKKAVCVECHSPKGGIASTCSTCHSFHTVTRW